MFILTIKIFCLKLNLRNNLKLKFVNNFLRMKINHFFNFFILFNIIANEEIKKADINNLKGMEYDDFINKQLLGNDTIKLITEDKKDSKKDTRELIQNQNLNLNPNTNLNQLNPVMQPLYYQSMPPMMQPMMSQPVYPQMVRQPSYLQNPQSIVQNSQSNQLNLQAQPIMRNGQAYYPMIQEKDKINENINKEKTKKKKLIEVSLKKKDRGKKNKKRKLFKRGFFISLEKDNIKSDAKVELEHNPYLCFDFDTVFLNTCHKFCKRNPDHKTKYIPHVIGVKAALGERTKEDKTVHVAINTSIYVAKIAAQTALFIATGIPPLINPLDLLIYDDGCIRCRDLVKFEMMFTCLKLKIFYRFTERKKKQYLLFKNNIRLCENSNTHCKMICYKEECRSNIKSTSADCTSCKSDCNEAAKYACINHRIVEEHIDEEFEGYFKAFKFVGCRKCTIESRNWAKKKCVNNVDCLKRWNDKMELACEGGCNGITDEHYYSNRFRRTIRFFMTRQDGGCEFCNDICTAEAHKYCYHIDWRCNKFFVKDCEHFCKYKDCPGYVRHHDKYPKDGDVFAEYIRNRLSVVMSRLKVHQKLRNEFDDKLERETREMAFRELRDNIMNGYDINEDIIYFKEKKLAEDQLIKSKVFENEFIKNAELLLLKKEKYDKYSQYAIFEEI